MGSRLWNAGLLSLVLHLLAVVILLMFAVPRPEQPERVWRVSFIAVPQSRPLLRFLRPATLATDSSIRSLSTTPKQPMNLKPTFVPPPDPGRSTATTWLPTDTEIPGSLDGTSLSPGNFGMNGNKRVPRDLGRIRYQPMRGESVARLPSAFNTALPSEPIPFPGNALENLSQHILDTRRSNKLDLVLLVDASQSMEDNIQAVVRYFDRMMARLSEPKLDVRLALVTFRHSAFFAFLGWDIDVVPLTHDFGRVKRALERTECLGGERALDAILAALERIDFRSDSERRMLLITDEYVSGNASGAEVLRALRKARVRLDVLGRDEPFQRHIARLTGGMWQSILDLNQ